MPVETEIEFGEKVWVIPAGRTKGGRQHRVPLSDRAVEILSEVPREEDGAFVFIGPRPGALHLPRAAMFNLLRRMGRADITTHGFQVEL